MDLRCSEQNRLLSLRSSFNSSTGSSSGKLYVPKPDSNQGKIKTESLMLMLKCGVQLLICQCEEHPLVLRRVSLIVCSSHAAPWWMKNSRTLMASAGTCNQTPSPSPPYVISRRHVVTTFWERCCSLVSSKFHTPIISQPLFLFEVPESESWSKWKAVRVWSHLWPFLMHPASLTANTFRKVSEHGAD